MSGLVVVAVKECPAQIHVPPFLGELDAEVDFERRHPIEIGADELTADIAAGVCSIGRLWESRRVVEGEIEPLFFRLPDGKRGVDLASPPMGIAGVFRTRIG